MNAHVPVTETAPASADAEFVLTALRCMVSRLRLLQNEVIMIGGALKSGRICPETAVEWTEMVAPGVLDIVAKSLGDE